MLVENDGPDVLGKVSNVMKQTMVSCMILEIQVKLKVSILRKTKIK
jgi:hypothetical protein